MRQKGVGVMGIPRGYKQNIAGRFGSNLIGIAAILLVPFFLIDILKDDSSAQEDCTITQVTDTVGGESEVWFLNSGGTLGGFDSASDVDGGNPDGSIEAYLVDTDTFVITQLTDSVGLDSFPFDISAGDTLVALSSQADLTGDNPDGNREIFLFDRGTETFTQITDTAGGDNIVPALNGDGTLIAIDSTADLTGGNADANREIFLFDSDTTTFTQLTNTVGVNSLVPDITPDGATIGFHSNSDLTGSNPDVSLEVFLFDVASMTFTQITDGDGLNSATAALSSDGAIVGLNSDTDPTGGNPDNNREIFLFDTNTMLFTQVTDSTGGGNSGPSLNSDGTRLVFTSNADLTGDNPDGNEEVFLFDADTGITTQITDSVGGSFSIAVISGDGTRILFTSASDIGGGNADGNIEVYFADCRVVVSDGNDSGGCALAGEVSPRDAGVNAAILSLVLFAAVSGVMRKRKRSRHSHVS
jgi:Tol biopolymer transport system component